MPPRGIALPFQPDLLAGDDARGYLDVEFFAGRQPDPLLDTVDRLLQRHRHRNAEVEIERDPARIEFEGRAGARSAAGAAGPGEHAVEDILEPATAETAAAK